MRYVSLSEAILIAEHVTGISTRIISDSNRLHLLDSALHAPQTSFGGEELYPDFIDKAAILAVRIAGNHPLPDGNKRLAWMSLRVFLTHNNYDLTFTEDEAVELMLDVASGAVDHHYVADWIRARIIVPH